eukprot:4830528-Pyramimonas_sp.AAC.1
MEGVRSRPLHAGSEKRATRSRPVYAVPKKRAIAPNAACRKMCNAQGLCRQGRAAVGSVQCESTQRNAK